MYKNTFLVLSQRYRPSNDGKYVQDDDKYRHTKDQFGGFGASRRLDGVVKIGGNRLRPTANTRLTTTTESPKTTPRPASPSIFIIDNNNNRNTAVSKNQIDYSSPTKASAKIIRQEQEANENGYHYL